MAVLVLISTYWNVNLITFYHKIEEMSSTLYEVFHLMCFFL